MMHTYRVYINLHLVGRPVFLRAEVSASVPHIDVLRQLDCYLRRKHDTMIQTHVIYITDQIIDRKCRQHCGQDKL